MADEPLNDSKRIAPSARVEKKDGGTEQIEPDTGMPDPKTAEDVKADAAIEDRFEATDN
jgi:hypothetical protein